MEKKIGEFSTQVRLTDGEAESVCKLGRASECCAYLGFMLGSFHCLKMDFPLNEAINSRIEEGTMKAKGTGGWEGCAWEGE
jgi:hypothetical protein